MNGAIFFRALGPLMLISGILLFFRQRKFVRESSVINGEVIEIRTGPARNNKTAYYPVIRYVDALTTSEGIYISNTACNPNKYKIGDPVELRYLNNGVKKQLCINTWFDIWGLSLMLALFGFIFSAFSLLLFSQVI